MFNASGKQLPQLTQYLTAATARDRVAKSKIEALITVGVVFSIGFGVVGPLLSIVGFHAHLPGFLGALAGIACAIPFVAMTRKWLRERRRPKTDQERIHQVAMEISRAMLKSRRLHKELDGSAAQLLEESARYWSEIGACLSAGEWSDPNLAPHWLSIRNQSFAAADQAMEEEVVLLQSSFTPGIRNKSWESVLEDVIDTFVRSPRMARSDHLPPGFQQAREVAEKLKLMTYGLRSATNDLVQSENPVAGRRAGTAIDVALNEIQTVQEAERELRQNLRG